MQPTSHVITIPKSRKPQEPNRLELDEVDRIRNSDFFPDIRLSELRNTMRADGTISESRLKAATIEAMATVNQQLKPLTEKAASLDEIESDTLNGEPLTVHRYKRAVFCLAMANLYERYRSFDSTKEGADKAAEYEGSVDDLRRDARFAIRDLLNINRWNAELI